MARKYENRPAIASGECAQQPSRAAGKSRRSALIAQAGCPEPKIKDDLGFVAPVTFRRLEDAIVYLAQCVVARGPAFAPFIDKLESELIAMQDGADPVSRARAILAAAKAKPDG